MDIIVDYWRRKVLEQQPVPQPTGTELALIEAKKHLAILSSFFIDNAAWVQAAADARDFLRGVPK